MSKINVTVKGCLSEDTIQTFLRQLGKLLLISCYYYIIQSRYNTFFDFNIF